MKPLVTVLSCVLAVLAIATPGPETQLEKRTISDRIYDPLGFITVDGAADGE
jgi:hypothetical protein